MENSGLVVVWFVGVLMALALSTEAVKAKLSGPQAKWTLGVLLSVCLAAAVFAVYATFAWTSQFYNAYLGLALAMCVFLAVLLLNLGSLKSAAKFLQSKLSTRVIAVGAGFSYTLFLTHYPIIIYLNGLDLQVNRFVMLIVILLITNMLAFFIAIFTEKKHRQLAGIIKRTLGLP